MSHFKTDARQQTDAFILSLTGVTATKRDSFRHRKRVFVRMEHDGDVAIYGFKLKREDAASLCSENDWVTPMSFGNMIPASVSHRARR